MDSFGSAVWERQNGVSTISKNLFMFLYGVSTLAGLALTAIGAYLTQGWTIVQNGKTVYAGPVNIWVLMIGTLVVSIIGVLIAMKSDVPLVSAFGYFLVAGSFGLLLGPVVAMYTAVSVLKVVIITVGLVAVLTVIGAVIPDSLESWGGWLFGGLSILILGQFGIPLLGWLIPGFPLKEALHLWDWIGVFLFGGYVIYDVNRATQVTRTVDNAIDCALALYLDIINIFIRLLELMGEAKNDD